MIRKLTPIILAILTLSQLQAEVTLPAIFTDHMVLQRDIPTKIWGWDSPGTAVSVKFSGRTYRTLANKDGRWEVSMEKSDANSIPQTILINGSSSVSIKDVLVGDVWLCSGQSNMAWRLEKSLDGDLAILASSNPQIRRIHIRRVGTQELQKDFEGQWAICGPDSAYKFSAVGYHFGNYLNRILDVPIGLIDSSWGGSAAEAWVNREALAQHPSLSELVQGTRKKEEYLNSPQAREDYEESMEKWEKAVERAKAENRKNPRKPESPEQWLSGNKRVGNIFAGVLHPLIGYSLKGVIWYQGETNVKQAYRYRELFPFLIQNWRHEWGQGDFPFYWVQLADCGKEPLNPGISNWAELRDAQSLALQLPNTGQAIAIDLGEGKDIHPRRKQEVAARLARWALTQTYGYDLPYRSPEYKSVEFSENTATVHIECFGSSLKTFDTDEVKGFALCGEDRKWHWAEAKIVGDNTIRLSSQAVPKPIAVRYAWADNPVCNVISNDDLPLAPFRTDRFPLNTEPKTNAK